MEEFKPTFLYLKQHTITGMLYFGITTRNVETYLGSGKRWLRHIKLHGKDKVVNLWYNLFLDQDSLKEFAKSQSREMNIVESESFANLKDELGIDGGTSYQTAESKHKMSISRKGKSQSAAHIEAISNARRKRYQLMRESGIPIPYPAKDKNIQEKIRASNLGKFWITDGVSNRRVNKGSQVPDNWTRGKIQKNKSL
jgi:hypothetical protein